MNGKATSHLKLSKCSDGYFRTFWRDEKGKAHTRSFGRDRSIAICRFERFHYDWKHSRAKRNPSDMVDPSLLEAWERFRAWADSYYVREDGTPTGESDAFRKAMKQSLDLYGGEAASGFSIQSMRRVREQMVADGLSVGVINARARRIRRVFKWLAEQEIVPAVVWTNLMTISALKPGRAVVLPDGSSKTPVNHGEVQPVAEAHFWPVVDVLPKSLSAMVQLQFFTGMRPGEVCGMRLVDLDTSGKTWLYKPSQHKTKHHGRQRVIPIGPRARQILEPYLTASLGKPIFSPRIAWAERCQAKVDAYVGGHGKGDYRNWKGYQTRERKGKGGEVWTTSGYAKAVARACREAEVPEWSPNQLRHNAATRLRKEFGLDVAQAVLGHSKADVTQVYAQLNMEKAVLAMEAAG